MTYYIHVIVYSNTSLASSKAPVGIWGPLVSVEPLQMGSNVQILSCPIHAPAQARSVNSRLLNLDQYRIMWRRAKSPDG